MKNAEGAPLRGIAWRLAVAVMAGPTGCARDAFFSDPQPIMVATTGGVVIGRVATAGAAPLPAAIDVLSPLTIYQAPVGDAFARRSDPLYIYNQGAPNVARAELDYFYEFAFCSEATCQAGPDAATETIAAVVGADTLAGNALRINVPAGQLYIFPDIVGSTLERAAACDAVFPSAFHGGGTLFVRGTPVTIGSRRPIVDACADAAITNTEARGVNTMFAVSTALPTSIMGVSTYRRLRLANPALPAEGALPEAAMYYDGARIEGLAVTVPKFVVTSKPTATAGNAGGACEALGRRARVLAGGVCDDDALCTSLPAQVEIAPSEGVAFLIVPDALGLLQALRAELRETELPEVDGVLGGNAIGAAEIDFDYPNNRILWRCRTADCRAEPAFAVNQKDELAACFTPPTVP